MGMDILTWLIVGLIAGVLAGLVVGGYGLLADIVIGIVGAFIGGWHLPRGGLARPFGGLAGTIFVAFIGAVVLLVDPASVQSTPSRIASAGATTTSTKM